MKSRYRIAYTHPHRGVIVLNAEDPEHAVDVIVQLYRYMGRVVIQTSDRRKKRILTDFNNSVWAAYKPLCYPNTLFGRTRRSLINALEGKA